MKKIVTILQPLKIRCLFAALFALSINHIAFAQCAASFTYTVASGTKTVTFTNTSTGGPTRSFWERDGGVGLSSAMNPVVTFQNPGYHYICVEVSRINDPTCYDRKCDSIFIPGTSTCKSNWFYYGDTNGMLWYNATQSLGANLIYKWDFDDGSASQLEIYPPAGHQFGRKGAHKVCLTVINKLDTTCHDSTCKMINNIGNCSPKYSYYYDTLTTPYTLHYAPDYTVTNTAYLWDFGDGTTSSAQYPAHQFATSGPHTVCLTVSNTFDSCSATSCDTIPAFGPSGVNELISGKNYFTIAPNPVGNMMSIIAEEVWPKNTRVSVYNSVGQKIIERQSEVDAGSKVISISTADLPEGFYYVEIRAANRIDSKKFFK